MVFYDEMWFRLNVLCWFSCKHPQKVPHSTIEFLLSNGRLKREEDKRANTPTQGKTVNESGRLHCVSELSWYIPRIRDIYPPGFSPGS